MSLMQVPRSAPKTPRRRYTKIAIYFAVYPPSTNNVVPVT